MFFMDLFFLHLTNQLQLQLCLIFVSLFFFLLLKIDVLSFFLRLRCFKMFHKGISRINRPCNQLVAGGVFESWLSDLRALQLKKNDGIEMEL